MVKLANNEELKSKEREGLWVGETYMVWYRQRKTEKREVKAIFRLSECVGKMLSVRKNKKEKVVLEVRQNSQDLQLKTAI